MVIPNNPVNADIVGVPGQHSEYSGPSILRPPMGPRKYGLILQVVLK